jgi:hypothetical protein
MFRCTRGQNRVSMCHGLLTWTENIDHLVLRGRVHVHWERLWQLPTEYLEKEWHRDWGLTPGRP